MQKTIELDPNFGVGYGFLAACYEKKGMYDEAVNAWEHDSALAGDNPRTVAELRTAYKTSGMKGFWSKYVDLLKERSERTYLSPIWVTSTMPISMTGIKRLNGWEKAYAERSGWLLELKIDPSWDKLRDDSRFEALLRKIQHPAPPLPN